MKNSRKISNNESLIGTTTSTEAFILNLILANDASTFRNQGLYLKNLNFLEYFADADIDNKISPLQLASYLGKIEIVKLILLNRTIDIDLSSEETGYTPLILACISGNFEIVEVLIENGAEINKPSKFNISPLNACFLRLSDSENYSYENKKICLKMACLLLDFGADINWIVDKVKCYTLLHQFLAIKMKLSEHEKSVNAECIKFLIEHGADKAMTTFKGKTCFDLIQQHCNFTSLNLLLINTNQLYEHFPAENKEILREKMQVQFPELGSFLERSKNRKKSTIKEFMSYCYK